MRTPVVIKTIMKKVYRKENETFHSIFIKGRLKIINRVPILKDHLINSNTLKSCLKLLTLFATWYF